MGMFQVDMVVEVPNRPKFAIEVSDPETKYFRTNYPTTGHRIRDRFFIQKGYKTIELNTSLFPSFDSATDE